MVFQWPWGTFATSLAPLGAQPRSGFMLVFVHVSSMKTKRLGSIRLWRFIHWTRRRDIRSIALAGGDGFLKLSLSA